MDQGAILKVSAFEAKANPCRNSKFFEKSTCLANPSGMDKVFIFDIEY